MNFLFRINQDKKLYNKPILVSVLFFKFVFDIFEVLFDN